MGHANLAQMETPSSSPARQSLSEIETAARRAAELCRQMLAYSGKGQFVMEYVNLSHVVREMGQLLEVSLSKKASRAYNLAPGLPSMHGDAAQVGQVVMNLITNASEAIGDGQGNITLTTGVTDCSAEYLKDNLARIEAKPGRYVFLEVADTGCGMDEATRAKMFDPFFSTKFTGRGLGMSAVLGIVRGHRGAIRVYSEPGRGTTVKVLFPVVEQQQAAGRDNPKRAAAPSMGRAVRVLVVDDDETVRRAVPLMLSFFKISSLVAADGREALQVFEREKNSIDCVLLDLTMPRMDGVECFRELRRVRPDVRVLLSSGYNEQEATQRFAGRGLAGFIQKPYVAEELVAKLRQIFGDAG